MSHPARKPWFAPIAIVGQGCVLPGALSPAQLWQLVMHKQDMLGAPPEHYWGVPAARVLTSPDAPSGDHTWSVQGGYVRGFESIFDPEGLQISPDLLRRLDPLFQWTVEAARQAWRDAGYDPASSRIDRAGVILGNLSYPTRALSDFALEVWQHGEARLTDPHNRYMSGLPAQMVARAMGLGGESFCLDAACASSLYAIKLASDRLQDGRADVMLVGGVNHADDLFLHVGFCALNAMSRTGMSRPFNAGADGLVPAEGAGFVVLKRLEDALRDGDRIQGVIRGVGLSNDGRGRGMLTPSQEGQWRAMSQAYQMSGLSPEDISLIECHATGTPLGDATELRSMATIFQESGASHDIPIGSLKSNLGHLITASGVAGLLKVLAAMEHGERPPTLHVEEPVEWLDETPFRLLRDAEPWECDGVRRAAINNFGFGGNNAHLLVEQWEERASHEAFAPRAEPERVAIVALSAMVSDLEDADALRQALFFSRERADVSVRAMQEITFDITKLRFPPNDLQHTLPQQLLTLKTAMQLEERINALPPERTGVYMGMQCDTEIARYGARWRMAALDLPPQELEQSRDQVIDSLVAAGVLGTMPNIVANRLNSQFNLLGPSYTVSAEEASGVVAVQLAMRALANGELDAAIVGAADLCVDPVHQAAARATLPPERHQGGDAGVVIVLKRLTDAERDQDTILAILEPTLSQQPGMTLGDGPEAIDLARRFGHAHAASGLLHLAVGALCCHHRALLHDPLAPADPWLPGQQPRQINVRTAPRLGVRHTRQADPVSELTLSCPEGRGAATNRLTSQNQRVHLFAAADRAGLVAALTARAMGVQGSHRLAIVCQEGALEERVAQALAALHSGAALQGELAPGIFASDQAMEGETAFVFTGPAGAYPQMGRELVLAMPELVEAIVPQFANIREVVGWIYDPAASADRPPVDKLWGSSYLCQVHAKLTRDWLKIPVQAAIGFCSGETNAMFAMGAWTGLEKMHADIEELGVFTKHIGNDFNVLRESWGLDDGEQPQWQTWRALAKPEEVRQAIGELERVHLTIISAPNDCVFAGTPEACAQVIERLGAHRCRDLGYNLVMHCAEARPFTEQWYDLHHRPTSAVPGVRFYTNATCSSYEVSDSAIAEALTGQAMQTVDFPALIEQAWQDGVRVFIEHGPQSGCSKWISRTLGDRPHLALSLDAYGVSALETIDLTLAKLFVAGVQCDWSAWPGAVTAPAPEVAARRQVNKRFPAHLHPVEIRHEIPVTPRNETRIEQAQRTAPTQTAPTQTAPARVAPPREPARREAPSVARSGAYTLPLPPTLPAVLVDLSMSGGWRAAAPHPFQMTPVLPFVPRAASPSAELDVKKNTPPEVMPSTPDAASPQTDSPEALVARHFERLSALHQDFLQRQAELQREFIAARTRLTQELTQSVGQEQVARHMPATTHPPLTHGEDVALSKPLFGGVTTRAAAPPVAPLPMAPTAVTPAAPRAAVSAPVAPKPAPVSRPAPMQTRSAQEPPPKQSEPQILPAVPTKKQAPAKKSSGNKGLKTHVITPHDQKKQPVGPTFDAEQIAVHASGKISEIFGPMFAMQDDWRVQVRMPEPPLLLCHRVTGIDCEAGKVGTGSLWCESDIPEDAWYLHEGRMPVGIMIESGQADLMLISWMGADFENKGDRVYRLLGCELMFHGGLARPGDTLAYDIHIDGHARQNAIRLFFFHYDLEIGGQVRLSVRNGQAGFFSYDELSESNGVIWTPADEDTAEILDRPFAKHPCVTDKRAFSAEEVQAFSEGHPYRVFGKGFERAAAHSSTPRIQSDKMRFMDEVLEFDPYGGPWNRGYLKAVQHISADDWFFDGHFLNDPCMPGTLMFEGCVQVMAFYMAACGWTIDRDGWVFEPVPFEPYALRCRGQVSPTSRELLYEVYVREVHDGENPKLYADLMCTVDGLKAFHCGRMGLQLTPAWPMDRQPELTRDYVEPKPVARANDGFAFGYDSLLACAWGKPTRAFGPMYAPFDSHRTVARLPGPPYHFISRVTEIDPDAQNAMRAGVTLEVEYDVPMDAWYFQENGAAVMPYAVLLEAALQPCGWLASYVGCALTRDDIDLAFRNLDGSTTQFSEVTPQTGTIRTRSKLTNIARAAGNIIVSFEVEMVALNHGEERVLTMSTVFGFFPPDALANQVGLPIKAEHRAMIEAPRELVVDLTTRPERYCGRSARLAEPMLLMLDRVTAYDDAGGSKGLGFVRAEKDVDPEEWFFKAHFFQDPVQPGSLGLEALLQLLQFAMLHKGLDEGLEQPRFEAIAIDEAISWKYRGQVLTFNKTISSTLEITEIRHEEGAVLAIAEGSLWVDGMRIYQSSHIGMRLVSSPDGKPSHKVETEEYVLEPMSEVASLEDAPSARATKSSDAEVAGKKPEAPRYERTRVLDPGEERDSWIKDHRPTHTDPALPMMSIVELLMEQARAAHPDEVVTGLREVSLKRWVNFPEDAPRTLRTRYLTETDEVVLELWWEAARAELSRYDEVARARCVVAEAWPEADVPPFEPLRDPALVADPYESGELFHGEAFQSVTRIERGSNGASSTLSVARDGVPAGEVRPGLLDAALQSIPHDRIELWWHAHEGDTIAYPNSLAYIEFYGETPRDGELKAEARFLGGEDRQVSTELRIYDTDGKLWMRAHLTEVLFPKGPLGRLDGTSRRAFLRDRQPLADAGLSEREEDGSTRLSLQSVMESNWFKGTLEQAYRVQGSPDELMRRIAVKDHFARKLGVHPSLIEVDLEARKVWVKGANLVSHGYELEHEASEEARVRDRGDHEAHRLTNVDVEGMMDWWSARLGAPRGWFGEDLYKGMIERFVSRVRFEDLSAMHAIENRSVLFLANHEVQIESLLITLLASYLTHTTVITMANAKHEQGWVGNLVRDIFSYPGVDDPRNIVYFNQKDPASMFGLLEHLGREVIGRGASVMVHAPGTRARSVGEPVERISSALLDMALKYELAIVPVYFSGGLPEEAITGGKLEFPHNQSSQEYYFGAPILPEALAALPYAQRREVVLDGINRLAGFGRGAHEGRPELDQEIALLMSEMGLSEVDATLLNVLMRLEQTGEDVQQVLQHGPSRREQIVARDEAHRSFLDRLVARFFGG